MNNLLRGVFETVAGIFLLLTIFIVFLIMSTGLLISILVFGIMNPRELRKITKSFNGEEL